MWPSGDTSKLQRQTLSERVENDSPSKQHPQRSRCSHANIWQNRPQDNKDNKKQRQKFYNGKDMKNWDNCNNIINKIYKKRHNTSQYICTQSGSTKRYKATTHRTKGRN